MNALIASPHSTRILLIGDHNNSMKHSLISFFYTDPTERYLFFFLNDPATPEISPLPPHAALPIGARGRPPPGRVPRRWLRVPPPNPASVSTGRLAARRIPRIRMRGALGRTRVGRRSQRRGTRPEIGRAHV